MTGNSLRVQGGVVTSYERRSHGIVELLTHRLRNRVNMTHYHHANAIDTARDHDFILVTNATDLEQVLRVYMVRQLSPPLIIHIDTPDAIAQVNYDTLAPGVRIVPIEHAVVAGEPDITLKITAFQEIIEQLEAQAGD